MILLSGKKLAPNSMISSTSLCGYFTKTLIMMMEISRRLVVGAGGRGSGTTGPREGGFGMPEESRQEVLEQATSAQRPSGKVQGEVP